MEKPIELIVECSKDELPLGLCKIKYFLPVINSIAIEAEPESLNRLRELIGAEAIHQMPHITAQMNRARRTLGAENLPCKGKGVAIAFLDTGISPIKDFEGRIIAFKDFVNGKALPYDDNGHGTHVAGIACGSGALSSGEYAGIAPSASIAALKTLDFEGKGSAAHILAGIQWIYDNKDKYNIRVANLSIGTSATGEGDPLVRAAEALWDSGVVVISAAGNNGPAPCTVSSPGISRKIITVGSSDDEKETNIWGSSLKNYSGRGPTADCIIKPDVLAPGSSVVSCLSRDIKRDSSLIYKGHYRALSGTSMSTPMVSGAVAALLEKHPRLTPDDVKYMLKLSCVSMGYPRNREGWGLLNVNKLLKSEVCYVK